MEAGCGKLRSTAKGDLRARERPSPEGQGHLLVGVDNDGSPSGIDVDEQLILKIVEFRDDGRVLPRPVITVERATFSGGDCVHVTVQASRSLPVRFDRSVYVRVGSSTRRAHVGEEQVLLERERAADLPFDQRPVAGASIADLDLELFGSTYLPAAIDPDVLAENERSPEQQLASLIMLDHRSGEPTALGLLVIGLDPSSWISSAYIQFVRYEDKDQSSNVLDHEELRGNLVGQLDTLGRLLPTNIRTAFTEEGLRQEDRPEYPLAALRELVLNALTHRDYRTFNAPVRILWFDNRVEITSPGGPYGVVTRETFDRRNDYRNPALAAAMKHLGYVNRFGRGIGLVRRALEGNGNPPAEFDIEEDYWAVTVKRAP